MGCIYTLGNSTGSKVIHNLCYNVFTFNYGAWCLYADQATSYMEWKDNICFNTKSASLHQHFGWMNNFTNNVLAVGGQGNVDSSIRTDPNQGMLNSFVFERNIVYFTEGELFDGDFNKGSNPERFYVFDYNLYFTPSGSEVYTFPNGMTFNQWQQNQHQDVHSIVKENPEFANLMKMNFTVSQSSPAFKLGYTQIAMNFGPVT